MKITLNATQIVFHDHERRGTQTFWLERPNVGATMELGRDDVEALLEFLGGESPGQTLFEMYAGMAMQALVTRESTKSELPIKELVAIAVDYAHDLIAEVAKRPVRPRPAPGI